MKAIMNRNVWTIFGWAAMVTLIRTYFVYMDRVQTVFADGGHELAEPAINLMLRAAGF